VKFLIQRDPVKLFKFAALQSDAAAPILAHFGFSQEDALKSITFIDEGKAYTKSSAAMQIAKYLPSPYNYLPVFECLPGFVRDTVYDCVATNRYRIFGQSDECLRPSKDVMSRFLDAGEKSKSKKSQ
jgi:predicted DCC family thiol-disulfide oxidoreductase YuxK